MARIIPVIDVMGGQVVRAVGGQRDTYAVWRSPLAGSSDPRVVARRLLEASGSDTLYVADLDLLHRGVSDWDRRFLSELPAITILDSGGLNEGPGQERVRETVALEVEANTPASVREMLRRHRAALPPVFSVDLRDGQLLGPWEAWGIRGPSDVLGLVGRVRDLGFRTVTLLDVAHVGAGRGPGTAGLCKAVREAFPEIELLTGGGVRGWDDVRRLEDAGADGVLVASALHDGTLMFPRSS